MIRLSKITAVFIAVLVCTTSYAQRYTTVSDTFRLNKEYSKTSLEIVNLNQKLIEEKQNLEKYKIKAEAASKEASEATSNSSSQAASMSEGNIADAKKNKRKADRAYTKMKASSNAQNKVKSSEKKIEQYEALLSKKSERLVKLDEMRSKIMMAPQL